MKEITMESEIKINREWINYIDLKKIDIYPIQFANCDRLYYNDSVYIFDEVGSGKTISSGLMAMDYLYNHPEQELFVITTNALTKSGEGQVYGQFLKDWYEKLPFQTLGLENRIHIANNHFSHFKQEHKYGLVIIDEAQLFLNKDSLRYQQLIKNIRAEKIIFLSATPIKNSEDDLHTYVDIAEVILDKNNLDRKWIENISTLNKEKEEIICNIFDIKSPITRYFKDTIRSLNVNDYKKIQARRLLPQLWEYGNGKTKNEKMLEMIESIIQKNQDNQKQKKDRFVLFTRYVKKEAEVIARYLEQNGFVCYSNETHAAKTYYVVTGENAYELAKFSGNENLPTVLILTYQVSEQGVNLPGFNYVINYHISSFPSSLEQRFGRIDRMGKAGSLYEEINMCFLISNYSWDNNTANFYYAISIYLRNLISYLPSKNTILSEEIFKRYIEEKEFINSYIEKINQLLECPEEIEKIIQLYSRLQKEEDELESIITEDGIGLDEENELLKFCDEHSIELDMEISLQDKDLAIKQLKADVKNTLREIRSSFETKNDFSEEIYKGILDSISDHIFYMKNSRKINGSYVKDDIGTLDAVEECGSHIVKLENFIKYRDTFREKIKLPILFENYRERVNKFFEEQFIQNRFEIIFPFWSYESIFRVNQTLILGDDMEITEDDKQMLIEKSWYFVPTLPIFKMFYLFKKIIQDLVWTKKGYFREKFSFQPFEIAFCRLGNYIKWNRNIVGVSDEFYSKYWGEDREQEEIFYISKNKQNMLEASNWYKLAYHCTRIQEYVAVNDWMDNANSIRKLFREKESHIKFLLEDYESYKRTGGDIQSFFEKHSSMISQLKENQNKIENLKDYKSLFHYYIWTKDDNLRTHIKEEQYRLVFHRIDCKVRTMDKWTQGIYNEQNDYYKYRVKLGDIQPDFNKSTLGEIPII